MGAVSACLWGVSEGPRGEIAEWQNPPFFTQIENGAPILTASDSHDAHPAAQIDAFREESSENLVKGAPTASARESWLSRAGRERSLIGQFSGFSRMTSKCSCTAESSPPFDTEL